jgi:hypothetical protein
MISCKVQRLQSSFPRPQARRSSCLSCEFHFRRWEVSGLTLPWLAWRDLTSCSQPLRLALASLAPLFLA